MAAAPSLERTKVRLSWSFVLSGLLFSTLASRFPDLRSQLGLTNAQMGWVIVSGSVGSLVSMPFTGPLVTRFGPAAVVRAGVSLLAAGLLVTAVGIGTFASIPVTVVGLFVFGTGFSLWDVAMNVEATSVERALRRTILPRFHAAWSGGTISGGLIGVLATALDVSVLVHVAVVTIPGLVAAVLTTRAYLPTAHHDEEAAADTSSRSVWLDPITIAVGLLALFFGLSEGVADDWVSLGVIDGYDTRAWVGVAGYFAFVIAMASGRIVGPSLIDRFGRLAMMLLCAGLVAVGVVVTVFAGVLGGAFVGIALWGIGTSLGFPVAMSAAADDPARGAARVAAVSTIAYGAFLIGPPVIGWLGSQTGTLHALLLVAVLMAPAALTALVARRVSR